MAQASQPEGLANPLRLPLSWLVELFSMVFRGSRMIPGRPSQTSRQSPALGFRRTLVKQLGCDGIKYRFPSMFTAKGVPDDAEHH